MHLIEKPRIRSRLRGWDLDAERFPDRTPAAWLALTKSAREGRGLELVYESHNAVNDSGMETLAAILKGDQAAWQDGRWYVQALGCNDAPETNLDGDLGSFLYRKPFTEYVRNGRVVTANTFYEAASFASTQTTVAAAPAPTTTVFTVNSIGAIQAGDLVRVGLATGYEYRRVGSIDGSAITLAAADPLAPTTTGALSAAPPADTTVDQVVEECAVFGDKPANYTTGTVTFTNGSATVTGAGTSWLTNVGAGDMIRLAGSRKWYTIDSVDSDTQLTLTEAYAEDTAAGASYELRGTIFNRGTGLRYVKQTIRGFVFESSWEMGGV